MLKIMIIGSPGAEKSTFARRLSKITKMLLYYLDMLWHNKDRTNVSCEQFDIRLESILTKDYWIIDGVAEVSKKKKIFIFYKGRSKYVFRKFMK